MEDLFKSLTQILAMGIEAVAAVIIGIAALEATFGAFSVIIQRQAPEGRKEQVRLRLGRWLAVGLEFELAADILRTAVAPTWNEIGQLASIVILRTVLNYFLQREIDKAARTPAQRGLDAAA